MRFPKIDSDDLVLFGSLALAALGNFMICWSLTGNVGLAAGTALTVFGILAAIIAFMAASEPSK